MRKLINAIGNAIGLFVVCAGAAHAQASVVLYGVADGNLRFDHTNLGTLKSIGSGGESGSRWGLRGSEDLGGGLRATFILEQGFDLSDNSSPQGNVGGGASLGPGALGGVNSVPHSSTGSRWFGRIATVGLAGPFGEIRFGRGYHPLNLVQVIADPFGNGTIGTPNNLFVNNGLRNDNAVYYDTPRFAGVQLSGLYQLGESTTSNATPVAGGQAKRGNDRYGAGVTYVNGPFYIGAGYEQIKSNFDTYRVRTGDIATTYDFGVVKLHAIYWRTKNSNPNTNPAFGSTVILDEHAYYAGVTVPFGAWDFLGGIGRLLDKSTSNVNAPLGSPKANFFGLGARYSLSKRTVLYTAYSRFNLKNGPCGNPFQGYFGIADITNFGLYTTGNLTGTPAACSIMGSAVATIAPANVNPYSYQFGIRHSF